MSKSFQGKVVLVTGGGSGIGRATALKMASLGASIALCDINLTNLEAVAAPCPTPTLAQKVDVGSTPDVQSFVDATLARFSKIDYVFNCAGVNPTSIPLEDTTDAYWDKLVNTNLKGVFLVTRTVLPHLQRGAAIVNVSSISGIRGSAMQSVYCTTKFGLIGMTKSLALELGPRGIRVNCVAPGYIDTPSNAGIVKGGEFVERMRVGNALERLGTPEEVADVVAFLFGEESRYMNGAVLEIDGGLKMSSTTSK
ncbi:short-chain dehydrogenase/reductase-like protein SDR [Plenodomus tracheiphilus IPT5]|uniref:Short-chain dehydrogenase/reductase-like protein SDR n=1 Tax=Plenodomus tracheiphilus IPT5 TaxID=1408161 RepID=A0A6A7BFU3_9PLEO|nr:short-chain dehydrogenase/reductase-like protein SDR [Plenodomus tracheiphilus IPT5]